MSQPPKELQKTDAAKTEASGAADGDKLKRKRQSQSCDACRARKVRCVRPDSPEGQAIDEGTSGLIPMTTGADGSELVVQCKQCIALGIKCIYDYQAKKRGPPN